MLLLRVHCKLHDTEKTTEMFFFPICHDRDGIRSLSKIFFTLSRESQIRHELALPGTTLLSQTTPSRRPCRYSWSGGLKKKREHLVLIAF